VNCSKACFILCVVVTLAWRDSPSASEKAPVIEVFTDSTFEAVSSEINTTVYRIDSIHLLQQALSQDLPREPEKAKQLALQRFQGMDPQLSRDLENAATGLLLARQYGIDRYPAIVFDGNAVVYGLTDISAATRLHQQWQAAGARQ